MVFNRSAKGRPPCQEEASSSEQSPIDRYCGVCCLLLPSDALPIETTTVGRTVLDRGSYKLTTKPPCDREKPPSIQDSSPFTALSDRWLFSAATLAISADRGCTSCAALRRMLAEQHSSLFPTESSSGSGNDDEDSACGEAEDQNYRRLRPWFRWHWKGDSQLLLLARDIPPFSGKYPDCLECTYKVVTLATDYTQLLPLKRFQYPIPAGLPLYDTASEAVFARVKAWLVECTENHATCRVRDNPRVLPRRILEISDGQGLRLVDGKGLKVKYACLSYRWGPKSKQLRLLKENENQFREGIAEAQLPRLFRDVRDAVCRLGLRYLWIDSMCIQQNNNDDWLRESGTMASVYENAHVTVAALVSHDCNDSLFRRHDQEGPIIREPIATTADGHAVYMMKDLPHPWTQTAFGADIEHWNSPDLPLLQRGWVHQERMLSRRIVYFSEHEVIWECRTVKRCECRYRERSNNVAVKADLLDITWRETVEKFTSLGLTEPSDKLPALAGVARKLYGQQAGVARRMATSSLMHFVASSRLPALASAADQFAQSMLVHLTGLRDNNTWYLTGRYLAGLWASDIHRGLMWSCVGFDKAARQRLSPRPEPLLAPTWTWASVCMQVYYGSRRTEWLASPFTLKKSEVELAGPDKFGPVRLGRLTIVARVFPATIYYGADATACIEALPSLGVRRHLREIGRGVTIDDNDDDGGDDAKPSTFVPPPPSHAGRDTVLTADQFALLAGKYAVVCSPDYTMQMSGDGYVASGTSVRCIVLGETYVLVTHCVDEECGYYKRLGCTGRINTIELKWDADVRETTLV